MTANGEPSPTPMGIGALLEVAVRIIRRHWVPLLILALLFAGPAALLTAATGLRLNEVMADLVPGISDGVIEGVPTLTAAQVDRLVGALAAYLLSTLVAGVLSSVGALGFSAVVVADYRARPIEVAEALWACLRRSPSVLAVIVVTSLVIVALSAIALGAGLLAAALLSEGRIQRGGPGAFLAILAGVAWLVAVIYLTMRWAAAFPAIVAEDLGWRAALSRTWQLSADNVWRILGVSIVAAFLTAVFAAVISQVLGLLLVDLLAPTLALDPVVAETIVIALGTLLLAPLAPVLMAALYFDLRARHDAPSAPSSAAPSR